jgi:hypothetical protein
VLGDLNDYYGSGPVETLRTGVQPPLLHTFDWLPQLERYTYIYNGGSQVLDHLLITPNLAPLVARVAPLHVNADYPGGDNKQAALLQKASDHEPVLLQLRPAGAGVVAGNLGFPDLTLILTTTTPVTAPAPVTGVNAVELPIVTTTDALGEFRFWGLPPGRYELRIDAPAHFSQNAQPSILSVAPGYQTVAAPALLPEDGRNAAALLLLAPVLIQQVSTR